MKNVLKSSISQHYLQNLEILSIESEFIKFLEFVGVIQTFANDKLEKNSYVLLKRMNKLTITTMTATNFMIIN